MEKEALLSNERLSFYQQILSQNFKHCFLNQDDDKKYVDSKNLKTNLAQTTQLCILSLGGCRKIFARWKIQWKYIRVRANWMW